MVDYAVVVYRHRVRKLCRTGETRFGYPMFVKPANLGSSVGISKANESGRTAQKAIAAAAPVTIARSSSSEPSSARNSSAPCWATTIHRLDPCEILPSRDFYDYEDKYLLDKTEFRIPPRTLPERDEEIRRLAVACFRAVRCEGMARVDFLLENGHGTIFSSMR